MENMVIKNINIIDWDLKQNFENVKILEKSEKSDFFFEISLISKIEDVNIPLVLEISKNELLNNKINWRYLAGSSKDDKISKISEIKSLSNDIKDLFKNKRFDPEYLKIFLEKKDSEKTDLEEEDEENKKNLGDDYYDDDYEEVISVKKALTSLEESIIKDIETEILISENIMDKRKTKFKFNLNRELSFFERFNLEINLSNIETLVVSPNYLKIVI